MAVLAEESPSKFLGVGLTAHSKIEAVARVWNTAAAAILTFLSQVISRRIRLPPLLESRPFHAEMVDSIAKGMEYSYSHISDVLVSPISEQILLQRRQGGEPYYLQRFD